MRKYVLKTGKYVLFLNSRRTAFHASPILLYPLGCTNTIYEAILTLLPGKVRRIFKNLQIFIIGAADVSHFAYRHGNCTLLCP